MFLSLSLFAIFMTWSKLSAFNTPSGNRTPIFFVKTTFVRSGRGRYSPGMESQVFLPMTTTFFFFGERVVEVTSRKCLRSPVKSQGSSPSFPMPFLVSSATTILSGIILKMNQIFELIFIYYYYTAIGNLMKGSCLYPVNSISSNVISMTGFLASFICGRVLGERASCSFKPST